MHPYLAQFGQSRSLAHLIDGQWHEQASTVSLNSPYTGQPSCQFGTADAALVDRAVTAALSGARAWAAASIKDRAQVLFQVRENIRAAMPELAATVSFESGKTLSEARAGVMKGLEVLEFALSLQNLDSLGRLEVSRGVSCEYRRMPLGVVAGITPFNFPAMVPMWMMPIALALGNAFIWKPSDKVPITSQRLGECFISAGLPKGTLTILQGGADTVNALIDHPLVKAIGFVGSTPVAKSIFVRGSTAGKRVLALGGAKNHIILMPDADPQLAVQGIVDSFTGCAGQRCMAASVVLAVGDSAKHLEAIAARASALALGHDMGAVITKAQVSFLQNAIDAATKAGATLLADGRKAAIPAEYADGNWLGPTVLDNVLPTDVAATAELFGPILSVVRVKNLSEALAVDDASTFGNATSVFTSSGAVAEEVARHTKSGMVGINVGVPVPREPFSFGGTHGSKFGHGEMTGEGSLNFWSDLKKVTSKWAPAKDASWMS